MTTNATIVACSFIAVAGALGVLVLRGRGGSRMEANLQVGKVKLGLKVSQEARQQAEDHLQKAVARLGNEEGLADAKQRLAAVKRIDWARVLWVDDSPDNNIEENLMLNSLGLSVTQTLSTELAMSYLNAASFDLVITDMGRPGDHEAGLTLLTRLADLPNRPAAIVYTLNVTPERRARAFELGALEVAETPSELLAPILERLGH